jgi:uncharacterized membrane protein YdbT with pleckstrin-like domain
MVNNYLDNLLGQKEKIILVSRQHWFILARSIFLEVSLILILLVISIVGAISFPHLAILVIVIAFVLLLIPIATMTKDILEWTNRQYIVTNRRVIQISGIINKNITDSSLEKVNDVKMMQSVFGRMFDYGDIEILTASELGVNLFSKISEPIKFKSAMINAKEELDQPVNRMNIDDTSPKSIPSLIASLEQLKNQGVITEEEFQAKKSDLLTRL